MKKSIWGAVVALLAVVGTASADWSLTDTLESTGGWVADGGGVSWVDTSGGAVGGLSATAGSEYLHVTATGSRRVEKTFSGFTVESSGTLNVSIDVGDRNDKLPAGKVIQPRLFADLNGSGTFDAGEGLGTASGTITTDGWATWTLSVDLSSVTNTLVGQTIGMSIRSRSNTGGLESISYDNLSIDYVAIPEPATMGLFAVFGGSLLIIRRKLQL